MKSVWLLAAAMAASPVLAAAQGVAGMRSTSAAIGATVPTASSPLFKDAFDGPDGPVDGALWQVTSGDWRKLGGQASTASAVFRANTRRCDFKDVDVAFDLTQQGLTTPSGEAWHGVHMFLRRYSEYTTYYVSLVRRDGKAMIKKKVQGGPSPSNGGTYYDLASARSPITLGRRHRIVGRAVDNADGSVTVSLFVDGVLVVEAADRGVGGAPLISGGSTGIRGDYDSFLIDNLQVTPVDATTAAAPVAPGVPASQPPAPVPAVVPSEAKAPQRFLSPSLADGINDAAEFGSDAEDVTVYDASGRPVFHGSKGISTRIVWNCREGAGRIVQSGAYIARIRKRDSTTVTQTFAVVK